MFIALLDDTAIEALETFTVVLSDAAGATLGARSSASVRLRDDDSEYSFVRAVTQVLEDGVLAQIGIKRSGHPVAPGSVRFGAAGGNARSGRDYVPFGGDLSWAPVRLGPSSSPSPCSTMPSTSAANR